MSASWKSLARDSRMSPARCRMRARSEWLIADQAGNAFCAAAIAVLTSSRDASATFSQVSPVDGSVTSNVAPSAAPIHAPSMNRSVGLLLM